MQATYVRPSPEASSSINNATSGSGSFGAGPLPSAELNQRGRQSLFKARPAQHGNGDRGLIEALVSSKVFQEYERAFTEATGLPVALRPVETWQLPHHGKRNEGPFCSLISQKSRACASCLSVQETLSELSTEQAHTIGCPNGLCDTAVPVRLGDRIIGYLQTGQVFRKKPTEPQFERAAKQVKEWGVDLELDVLRNAYFSTRVIPPRQHDSVVKLLSIFAQHLAMLSNQVVVQHENAEPPVITRAKEYIQEHQG